MENYKLAKLNDCDGDLRCQWYVFYSYRHPETKQFQRFKKVISMKLLTKTQRYASASEHIKKINRWLREGNNPFDMVNSRIMLSEAMDLYIQHVSTRLRKRTYYTYRNYVSTIKKFLLTKNLTEMRARDFNEDLAITFFDWIKSKMKVTNRTHNNYRTMVRAIFNFMLERNIIEFNPFLKIPKLELEQSELTALTPTELQILKKHLPEDNFQLYAISMIIFYCFIRPQEIVRLKIENFDLVNQRVYMSGKTSKNKKTQVVVIPDPLLEILVKLKNLDAHSGDYVFSRNLLPGTFQIAPTRIAEAWRKWCKKYEVDKQIYHLKHTGVGMAIQAGINVRDLQLQLRHYSLDETQKYLEKFNNVASDRLKSGFPRI